MKTQNTLENKANFFAQYLNQQVFYQDRIGNIVAFYLSCGNFTKQVWIVSLEDENFEKNELSCNANINECQLILTPLSQISDEDINFVAKVCHQVPNLTFEIKRQDDIVHATSVDKSGIERHICINFKYATINCNIRIPEDNDKLISYKVNIAEIHMNASRVVGYIQSLDYLRSKGYAVPYMDLSVEDLVEYGWIKLKEN